jgi:hypothetical protein
MRLNLPEIFAILQTIKRGRESQIPIHEQYRSFHWRRRLAIQPTRRIPTWPWKWFWQRERWERRQAVFNKGLQAWCPRCHKNWKWDGLGSSCLKCRREILRCIFPK